jgi:hypothetical protein
MDTLKDRVYTHIYDLDHVSFAGLCSEFPEIVQRDDGFAIMFSASQNIVIWPGLTEEFIEVYKSLRDSKRIVAIPCGFIIYMIDGAFPTTMPVAKSLKRTYKKPHWVPVVLRPFDKCPASIQKIVNDADYASFRS